MLWAAGICTSFIEETGWMIEFRQTGDRGALRAGGSGHVSVQRYRCQSFVRGSSGAGGRGDVRSPWLVCVSHETSVFSFS